VALDPALPSVKLEGGLRWNEGLCQGSASVHTEPFLDTSGSVTLRLSGAATGACGEFSVYRLALPQPQHAEDALRAIWREMGGSFTGRIHQGLVPPDAVPFVAHESPPLVETVRQINKFSNNVMARTLLLDLGAAYEPPPATVSSGGRALTRILANHGLSFPELVIDNGSGLSRDGRVSVSSLASLLLTAWRSPVMPEFVSSLSISGVDGTFRKRLREPGAEGMAHLKSGSLRDVRAVAGFVLSSSGRRFMVASVVNDEHAEQANDFHDMLIEWLSAQ
jgi:D-alanyl-D-alanine carboxypeptidase/D-alanyl-D-alanine-endopeptidase (penicillin-binding protein 4)